jgi:hypothetical protein
VIYYKGLSIVVRSSVKLDVRLNLVTPCFYRPIGSYPQYFRYGYIGLHKALEVIRFLVEVQFLRDISSCGFPLFLPDNETVGPTTLLYAMFSKIGAHEVKNSK